MTRNILRGGFVYKPPFTHFQALVSTIRNHARNCWLYTPRQCRRRRSSWPGTRTDILPSFLDKVSLMLPPTSTGLSQSQCGETRTHTLALEELWPQAPVVPSSL